MSTLFRREAIDGQRQAWLGEVRLARPISLDLLTAFAVGVAALLIAFLFIGEYARKAQLDGTLVASGDGAALQARLYAPAATVGLLRPGQEVDLRFEAWGAQQSGAPWGGRIAEVARTPDPAAGAAPYRVVVELASQSVVAGGRRQPLAAGMRVDAEVEIERRRLVDWLFEPASRAAGD